MARTLARMTRMARILVKLLAIDGEGLLKSKAQYLLIN